MDIRIKLPRLSSTSKSPSTETDPHSQHDTDVECSHSYSSDSASIYMSDVESVFSDESEDAEWERIQRQEMRPGRRVPAFMRTIITDSDDPNDDLDFTFNTEESQQPSHTSNSTTSDYELHTTEYCNNNNHQQSQTARSSTTSTRPKHKQPRASSTATYYCHQHSDSSDEE